MIFETGHLMPTLEQIAHVKRVADDSFCSNTCEAFNARNPIPKEYIIASPGIALRLRNVEPHEDPFVGDDPEPRARRALFWLIDAPKSRSMKKFDQTTLNDVWFGCGADLHRMKVGDWVLFNDAKKHFVMSDRIWRGAAWQLRIAPKIVTTSESVTT